MYIHFNPPKLFSWLLISGWRRNVNSMQIERLSPIRGHGFRCLQTALHALSLLSPRIYSPGSLWRHRD